MTTRIGIDPGKSTGIAWFYGPQFGGSGQVEGGVQGFIEWLNIGFGSILMAEIEEVVIEDFDIDGTRSGTWSSEIVGIMKDYAYRSGGRISLVVQKRSDKAALFNQVKKGDAGEAERFAWLKERGFERIGKGHNLDAITHVLVRGKKIDRAEFYNRYWK